jgi:hypothetical protein
MNHYFFSPSTNVHFDLKKTLNPLKNARAVHRNTLLKAIFFKAFNSNFTNLFKPPHF